MFKILAVNPGSTSTKIAVYEDKTLLFSENISHDAAVLSKFNKLYDQQEIRRELILNCLERHGVILTELSAVVGRGGLLPPVKAGAYSVNDVMLEYLTSKNALEHASNLGAVLADSIASPLGIPAYIYDSISVDEMEPVAKISGLMDMERFYIGHKLNVRATAMKYAESINKGFNDTSLIIAHLGGGISVSYIKNGKIVDIVSDDEGAFSPERTGGLPMFSLIKYITEERPTEAEMFKIVKTKGGLYSHLGTNNCLEVEEMIESGNEYARIVYNAMAYNICKTIGRFMGVCGGICDGIIITGGIANSEMLVIQIKEYLGNVFPIVVMPGENEMEALAYGALRVLTKEEDVNIFNYEE